MEDKRCSSCKCYKFNTVEFFHVKYGKLQGVCRACVNSRARKRYKKVGKVLYNPDNDV